MNGQTLVVTKKDGTQLCFLHDVEDAGLVLAHNWVVILGYASTWIKVDGVRRVHPLHRLVMGLNYGDPRIVDHINGRRFDNRRENLRVTTRSVNGHNQAVINNRGSSKYRGVSRVARDGRWEARLELNGQGHYLGRYSTEQAAANAVANFRATHELPPGY